MSHNLMVLDEVKRFTSYDILGGPSPSTSPYVSTDPKSTTRRVVDRPPPRNLVENPGFYEARVQGLVVARRGSVDSTRAILDATSRVRTSHMVSIGRKSQDVRPMLAKRVRFATDAAMAS